MFSLKKISVVELNLNIRLITDRVPLMWVTKMAFLKSNLPGGPNVFIPEHDVSAALIYTHSTRNTDLDLPPDCREMDLDRWVRQDQLASLHVAQVV